MILKQAKRLIILLIGGTVILIGLVMLLLPGPAFIVIPTGLGILATEFVWARHLLHKIKEGANNGLSGIKTTFSFFKRRPSNTQD